jgi:hypothetical protein
MATKKPKKPATPEVHEHRFLKAGGRLTEEQWENMSKRTRQLFLQGKEIRKETPPPAENTGKAKRAGLKQD